MIRRHRCPICEKEFDTPDDAKQSHFPFCSDRCRKVDLCRWWDGRYAVVEELDPQVVEFLKHDPDIDVKDISSEG